jgi:hypothetical protein
MMKRVLTHVNAMQCTVVPHITASVFINDDERGDHRPAPGINLGLMPGHTERFRSSGLDLTPSATRATQLPDFLPSSPNASTIAGLRLESRSRRGFAPHQAMSVVRAGEPVLAAT